MSISVSSMISKIFERFLAPHLTSKCVIEDKQLGFRTYRCRTSALRLIRKILRHFDYVPTPTLHVQHRYRSRVLLGIESSIFTCTNWVLYWYWYCSCFTGFGIYIFLSRLFWGRFVWTGNCLIDKIYCKKPTGHRNTEYILQTKQRSKIQL